MIFAFLLFGALFGYLGYREAANFERQYGRSPWGLSPAGWGVVVFIAGIFIGGVLLCIARSRTKREIQRTQGFTATAPVPSYAAAGVAPAAVTNASATYGPPVTDAGNPYAPPAPSGPHPGSATILPKF